MRERIAAFDWSRTSVGERSGWPPLLHTLIDVMLDSRFPMSMFWGPDFVQIYNDGYVPLMGARHPESLGTTVEACWPEVWHIVGPLIEGVWTSGVPVYAENMPFVIRRNGYDEEAFFTFCYSRVGDAAAGGVLCTNVETTASVQREAELGALRERLERDLTREHQASLAFQNAALPQMLPRLPGLAFDAIYEAAGQDALVGGDWYDAFRLSDGRVVVSVGDVMGSGLAAAVTMVATRQAIRGAAQVFPEPAAVLDAADRALRSEQPDRIVTTFLGIVDPFTMSLTYASAGHPPPLLLLPDGTIDELAATDLPLGLRDDLPAVGNVTVAIPQGALLVLYTDGLTEATRDVVEGEGRLRETLRRRDVHDAANPAAAIRQAMLERASDDVAIMTVRFVPDFERITRWSFRSDDGETATSVRREFADILSAGGATDAERFDAEVVFGELLGNVVRHTGGGQVEIALDVGDDSPVLHMLDRGPGFTYYARLPKDTMSESGRGLFIATALARDLSVRPRMRGGSHARVALSVKLPNIGA